MQVKEMARRQEQCPGLMLLQFVSLQSQPQQLTKPHLSSAQTNRKEQHKVPLQTYLAVSSKVYTSKGMLLLLVGHMTMEGFSAVATDCNRMQSQPQAVPAEQVIILTCVHTISSHSVHMACL